MFEELIEDNCVIVDDGREEIRVTLLLRLQ